MVRKHRLIGIVSAITLDFEKYIMKRIEQKGIIDKINEEFEKAESQYIKRQKKRYAVNCTDAERTQDTRRVQQIFLLLQLVL